MPLKILFAAAKNCLGGVEREAKVNDCETRGLANKKPQRLVISSQSHKVAVAP